MSEYLTESVSISRHLRPNESLEIEATVPNAGAIVAMTSAKWDRIFPPDPTKRLLEIYKPNTTSPIVSRLDGGFGIKTFLHSSASAGDTGVWKARVTNKENSTEIFKLTLSYPGTTEIKTIQVPVSLIDAFVQQTLEQITIHLTNGDNNSYIRFPASMNVGDQHFTIPGYSKNINMPWPVPDIKIREHISNINSKSVDVALGNRNSDFSNGYIDMNVVFETSGHEIKGTLDANIGHMDLTVKLGLTVENRRVTYEDDNIEVDFPITIDLVNVPDFIEDAVNGLTSFRKKIRNAVIAKIKSVFAANSTREALSNALNNQLRTLLGENAQIVLAKVENNTLTIKYYNS
ncbi:hypothetical protein [Sulfurimonas sp.]|uniref:hypothetical protein n=1 Tax=Sulfurimonas sp. TaxID=2022749 RepID=UPI003D0E601C